MGLTGIDIGTNRLVSASLDKNGDTIFKTERDAFYRISPNGNINRKAIKMSLDKTNSSYLVDNGDFIVVGEAAIYAALDRNDKTRRPMVSGIISPKDKNNLPILKLLIKNIVGEGNGEKLCYSVPAKPMDGDFDIDYHKNILEMYFTELGYKPEAINEAFAVGLSELLDDGLTGLNISMGAGLANVCMLSKGQNMLNFSTTKSGDYIDTSVAYALDMSKSLVQVEKECGIDLLAPKNTFEEAVVVYTKVVIKYLVENMNYEFIKNKSKLPIFREPLNIVVSGGLANMINFNKVVAEEVSRVGMPFDIKAVKRAQHPDNCVASGALLAARL